MGIQRNVFCPYYNDCLDNAVKTGEIFSCKDCEFENERAEENQLDTFGCYLFLLAIYFPEAYRGYRRIERAGDLVILNRAEEFIMDFFETVLSRL